MPMLIINVLIIRTISTDGEFGVRYVFQLELLIPSIAKATSSIILNENMFTKKL